MTDYLALFRRIPDDIVLSVSSREFYMQDASSCVCGWVLREQIARATDRTAEEVTPREWREYDFTPDACAKIFGGEWPEWSAVFAGVTDSRNLAAIELAWVDRLDEAVRRSR